MGILPHLTLCSGSRQATSNHHGSGLIKTTERMGSRAWLEACPAKKLADVAMSAASPPLAFCLGARGAATRFDFDPSPKVFIMKNPSVVFDKKLGVHSHQN